MYQFHLKEGKASSAADLLLVVFFVLVAVFMRPIVDALSSVPAPFGGILKIFMMLLFVGVCCFFYSFRLCSYRYTVIHAPRQDDEPDQYGNKAEWPWPVGTVVVEKMVSDKGKIIDVIAPDELTAFVRPEEADAYFSAHSDVRRRSLRSERYCRPFGKNAAYLIYRRSGSLRAAAFRPDETFAAHLETLLRIKAEASE